MSFTEIKAEELKDNPFDLIGKQWMLITAGNEEKCKFVYTLLLYGHPIRAAYLSSVTILCQNRLSDIWSGKIVCK